MDLTPRLPEGRQLVQAYRPGGFTIGGRDYEGSVLVFPSHTVAWPVTAPDQLTAATLRPVVEASPPVDLLLLGSGDRFALLSPGLRRELRGHGLVVEIMDTAAACRTYNVLLAEERRVAAALIAVS
ncbi:MAG TPA: Mth938-like domain-containing protein [Geminicoccaceae bacterium]|nr:Mth938-like domain-containing protein [Geminicoccaceae bacterium]